MRSPDEVPVGHLIVDASAFIKNAPLHDIGAIIYTIPEVVAEIRDKQTLKEISKKTGDYPALSLTDLKLLALCHDLHVQYLGKETINYEVKSVLEVVDDERPDAATEKTPFGFVMPNKANKSNEMDDEWDSEEDDDEGWIDESNLLSVLGEEYGVADKIDGHMSVAVISSDFALQNVLMHMKLHLVSIDGLVIKQLKSFVLRCRACSKLTSQMEKEFCQKCGNKSLERMAVTVDTNGHIRVHINWHKLLSRRAKTAQLRNIKGGKHDNCDRFFEDQRMPQNRASKIAENSLDDSPFLKHDVTSRSAILGIRPNRRHKMPYYCHQCQATVEANEHLQCSRCNGEFIEEVPNFSMGEEVAASPMHFFQAIIGGGNVPTQQRNEANESEGSQPSSGGIFGSILNNIFSGAQQASSSNASSATGEGGQQPTGQQGEPFFDFFQQLVSNLSAHAAPGTRVQINFHGGTPTIQGNINNYVIGDGNFDQLITQFLNAFEQQQQGLSEDDLTRLPMTKITEEQVQNGQQCTTCMDDFELDQEVVRLDCKHVFHEDCIAPWLRRANTCPICRTTVDPSEWPSTGKKPKPTTISDVDELD